MDKVRVLIVDDSALMRKYLSEVLGKSRRIEVVGTAMDPYIAVNKIRSLNPDIITLDIEMPRMDGLTFLSKLMISNPLPVIMVSSRTEAGASATVKALELGAVDFILKPGTGEGDSEEFARNLIEKILATGKLKMKRKIGKSEPVEIRYTADIILEKKDPGRLKTATQKVIAIGASTGGTEVIYEVLAALGENTPGIVIAQHMPEKFTDAFARRVNAASRLQVKEGENGERLYQGMAVVAPGGKHMLLKSDSRGYYIEINDGPPVNRHKPSVDVLFRSVSQYAGPSALGILCTGMGNDGASGLLEMKQAGARTVAQDEGSCIVYGMPKEAVLLGAVDVQAGISGIIEQITLFNAD